MFSADRYQFSLLGVSTSAVLINRIISKIKKCGLLVRAGHWESGCLVLFLAVKLALLWDRGQVTERWIGPAQQNYDGSVASLGH